MKGLLHRIAAGAMGAAAVVRSDARLTVGTPRPFSSVAEPALLSSAGTGPSAAMVPRAPVSSAGALHDYPADGEPRSMPRHRERSPWLTVDAVDSKGPEGVPIHTTAASPLRMDDRDGGIRVQVPLPRPSTDSSPWSGDRPAPHAVRLDTSAERREPAPLLSPAHDVHAIRGPITAGPAPRHAAAVAEQSSSIEPREVHIHIGTVEVTAVHEPAPPRRRPASTPAPPPMSLETYFAKRGRA